MTEYTPGQLYVATVRGVPHTRVLRTNHSDFSWLSEVPVHHKHKHFDEHLKEIRPLVTLDPESRGVLTEVVQSLSFYPPGANITPLVDSLQKTLRRMVEPGIPEPGLYAVVKARGYTVSSPRVIWLKDGKGVDMGFGPNWDWVDGRGNRAIWEALQEPEILRPGIEPNE